MLLSPGYHYEPLSDRHFLYRNEVNEKFMRVLELSKRYRSTRRRSFSSLPPVSETILYAMGNVTRTPEDGRIPVT